MPPTSSPPRVCVRGQFARGCFALLALALLSAGLARRAGAQGCSPRLFASDTVRLSSAPGATGFCLADGRDLTGFSVSVNAASAATRTDYACGADGTRPTLSYTLGGLPGGGLAGSLYLLGWSVSGTAFADTSLPSARDLADYMRSVDPAGGWRYVDAEQRIRAAVDSGAYSSLRVRDEASGTPFDLPVEPAPGTLVDLPSPGATYTVRVAADDGRCAEEVVVVRADKPDPATGVDTLAYTLPQDSSVYFECITLEGFARDVTQTAVCAPAAHGTVVVEAEACFTYTPDPGFVGEDYACLRYCDASICDSAVLKFTVEAPPEVCSAHELLVSPDFTIADCDGTATALLRLTRAGTRTPRFYVNGLPARTEQLAPDTVLVTLGERAREISIRDGASDCEQRFPVSVSCAPVDCAPPFASATIGQGIDCGAATFSLRLPVPPAGLEAYTITVDDARYVDERRGVLPDANGLPTATEITVGNDGRKLRAVTVDDGAGCTQRLYLVLACVRAEERAVDVALGETLTVCVDDAEVFGALVTLTTGCIAGSGAVDFIPSPRAGCVDVRGALEGEATACLVACNALGVCDTTYLLARVGPPPPGDTTPTGEVNVRPRPIAVPDALAAIIDEPLSADLLRNDSLRGGPASVTLVAGPRYGRATLGVDGWLQYTHDGAHCGSTDTLTYRVCQGGSCSVADVTVRLRCDKIFAYQGFSPNGDGVNDAFVVEGATSLSGSTLQVFNRWGTEVYRATDYANDWTGDWEGRAIPDGTYFYVLTLTDGDAVSGFCEVRR